MFFSLKKLLIHGRSRTVLAMLKEASNLNKHFDVYVTETSYDKSGYFEYFVENLMGKCFFVYNNFEKKLTAFNRSFHNLL